MDTLLREPDEITRWSGADELLWDVPTGILTHEPERAEPGAEHVWPEVSGNTVAGTPTSAPDGTDRRRGIFVDDAYPAGFRPGPLSRMRRRIRRLPAG